MHPLPKTPPPNFRAKAIVYRNYTYDVDAKTGLFQFKFEETSYIPHGDIATFIGELIAGTANLKTTLPWNVKPTGPLDIMLPHKQQCYVVIELDKTKNWQFRSGGPGITSKTDYGDDNADLTHLYPGAVDEDGQPAILSAYGPGVNGCRLLHFAVARRAKFERQRFNIHVEMTHPQFPDSPMEVIFDPDIPDDGGGIPMFGYDFVES
jgi:hypothetical protein